MTHFHKQLHLLLPTLTALLLSVSLAAQDPARVIDMEVDGLVCAFCAQGISKRLGKMDATDKVYVSLEKGHVAVALKPGHDIDDNTLRSALTDAGYTVRTITRSDESLDAVRARVEATP